MDPIAPGLLTALASGTAGQQIWFALRNLVARRPGPEAAPDGEGGLVALDATPDSVDRGRELAGTLAGWARQDLVIARALEAWRREAGALPVLRIGTGEVRNEISGGTFQGAVVQGRGVNGSLNFGC